MKPEPQVIFLPQFITTQPSQMYSSLRYRTSLFYLSDTVSESGKKLSGHLIFLLFFTQFIETAPGPPSPMQRRS